jgi:imidazolonepropionase-like amidohydrolase
VIRAATATAAEGLGRGADLGTLEPGKLADLLLIDGDPANDVGVLRDKRRIALILKAGDEQSRQAGESSGREFDPRAALASEGLP